MNEKNDVHIFVWRATPAIQCARRFFHSYPKETKKINNQFLNNKTKYHQVKSSQVKSFIHSIHHLNGYITVWIGIRNILFFWGGGQRNILIKMSTRIMHLYAAKCQWNISPKFIQMSNDGTKSETLLLCF